MAGRQLAAAIIGEWKSTSRRRVELDFQWDLAIAIVDSSDQKKELAGTQYGVSGQFTYSARPSL